MIRMFMCVCQLLSGVLFAAMLHPAISHAQSLEQRLLAESAQALADDALQHWDAKRGAVVFHQTFVGCAKCHSVSDPGNSSPDELDLPGPNLAMLAGNSDVTNRHLVESVLKPSAAIRKGFETITVAKNDGSVVTGLQADSDDSKISVRDPATSQVTQIARADIDEVVHGSVSVMPAGVVNNLASRQQFLDLIRYVTEIRDGGPERAKELQPSAALVAFTLPEYEARVDHAALIRSMDQAAFERGEAIYSRLCVNCHGTRDQPGSLPTALRFAEGKFRNGSNPFAMYQTLTHGFGLMVPQTWMVPRQKYDVIHYIRESLVRRHNPDQYVEVTDDWLASIPKGDTLGPEAVEWTPWSDMDYGPWMFNTVEVGRGGSNIAYKGLTVRLDPGPGGVSRGNHWILFDHDTMRIAGAWSYDQNAKSRFIDWQGIHFDGRHQAHPHAVGDLMFANPTGPGWADPDTGSFEDNQRVAGRDDRSYGPLQRRWSEYHGMHHLDDKVVVAYSVGDMQVKEQFGQFSVAALQTTVDGDQATVVPAGQGAGNDTIAAIERPVFVRSFQLSATQQSQRLLVATDQSQRNTIHAVSSDVVRFAPPVQLADSRDSGEETLRDGQFDGTAWLQVSNAAAVDTAIHDFSLTARIKTTEDGVIFARTMPESPWVPDGVALFIRDGRLTYDIGWVGAVQARKQIADGQWHDVGLTWIAETVQVSLFVDGNKAANGKLAAKSPLQNAVVRLGYGAENFPQKSAFKGQLQDVRFWRRALTVGQSANIPPDDDGLIAHWLPSDGTSGMGPAATFVRGTQAANSQAEELLTGVTGDAAGCQFQQAGNRLYLLIPPSTRQRNVSVWMTRPDVVSAETVVAGVDKLSPVFDVQRSASQLWPEELITTVQAGVQNESGFAVDILTAPEQNPWLARLRFSGLDFFDDNDRMAVCSWDGDVFVVTGLSQLDQADTKAQLTWRRVASGLFQPLGLKIVDGRIYLTCRDQLVILNDFNGDGATDFFECFNNDQQVTEHFHEFAMGLQRDEAGNFYYAKSARHALKAIVPHHGTLLKVAPDGATTEILATGFRAANGVCLNPDGSFIVTDQEGHWNPKNRINWVLPGRFYGNMYGYHDVVDESDSAMEQPLCWITNAFDRSPAELLWVESPKWGNLDGTLLNLSYGYGKVYNVPHEHLDRPGSLQGGMCELPIPQFPTGTMRGRFHPSDGQLYVCGLFAWGSSQQAKDGGLYRIRYAGAAAAMPVKTRVSGSTLSVTFSDAVSPDLVNDPDRYTFRVWSLERTKNYGSKHIDEHEVPVRSAALASDGCTVILDIPDLKPTWCYELRCRLQPVGGVPVERIIHGTIHQTK